MRLSVTYILIILLQLTTAEAQTGVYGGVKGCNTHWQGTWLMTPAAELTLTGKYLALSMDGTFGTFTPPGDGSVSQFQSRASMIPQLRLQFFRSLFITVGYGVAHVFSREDRIIPEGSAEILNSHEFAGEIRAGGGLGISLGSRISLVVKSEYSRISSDNYMFSVSAGLLFKNRRAEQRTEVTPEDAGPVSLIESPELVPLKEAQKAAAVPAEKEEEAANQVAIPFRRAAVIHASDIILTEFNMFIETLLAERGVTLVDWGGIHEALKEAEIYPGETAKIARFGREQFGLEAVVETALRYEYIDSFGGGIRVNHASVRVLDTADYTVIGVAQFESRNAGFDECKQYFRTHVNEFMGAAGH